jgi:hypothetical protein
VTTDPNPRLTLRKYYLSIRGLATVVAAVVIPFASKIVGSELSAYLFPPLGDVEGMARLSLVVLCLGLSVGVYFLVSARPAKSQTTIVWVALIVTVVSLLSYFSAYQRFVRRIEIPALRIAVYVSVGYERTPEATQIFGAASDWEMLRRRGFTDEDVSKLQLWTRKSIIIVRLGLFSSYALTILGVLFLFTFGLMRDIAHQDKAGTETS